MNGKNSSTLAEKLAVDARGRLGGKDKENTLPSTNLACNARYSALYNICR